jgi:hypothetical protein
MLQLGRHDAKGRRAARKVPVAEVAAEAYRGVFGRLGLFFDLAWLPLLVVLAAVLIPGLVGDYLMPEASPPESAGITAADVIETILALVCFNAFAVRWHHAMLFPDPHRVPRGIFPRAWVRFLLYTVVVNLVPAAIVAAVLLAGAGATPDGLAVVAGAGAAALTLTVALAMRFALLLPAAAFGQPVSWGAAWRLMRGNTWRLLACTAITCVPVMVAVLLLLNGVLAAARFNAAAAMAAGRLPLGAFILHAVVGTLLNFVTLALAASVLAGFYRRIVLRSDL